MKLDDRAMTILTALLLLVGVGAVMQGGGGLLGGGAYQANSDNFTLRAGRVQTLDVLLNDLGTDRIDPANLRVAQQPSCGSAIVIDGAIQYSGSDVCSGKANFTYCVADGEECLPTMVNLTLLRVENDAVATGGAGGAPVFIDTIAQAAAPQDAEQTALKQPMRLTLPANAEVITPSAATEAVRRIAGESSGTAIEASDAAETTVIVANTAARSGRVAFETATLDAPDMAAEGAGVVIAAPRTAESPRPSAAAPSGLALAAPGLAPQGGAGFTPPTPASRAEEPAIATATPPLSAPEPDTTEIARLPQPEAADAPAPVLSDAIAAPGKPAPQEEVLASAPEAQVAEPQGFAAPAEPADDAGVLASLARSNTVIGATVSAAKALFAPSTPTPRETAVVDGRTAPRPDGMAAVATLGTPGGSAGAPVEAPALPQAGEAPRPSSLPQKVEFAALDSSDAPFEPRILRREQAAPALDLPRYTADPAATAACAVDLALQVQIGAEIVGSVSSPCRPDSPFIVEHEGLAFTAFTDGDGVANFVVPALVTNATVRVSFPDGAASDARAVVEGMTRMTRVAVVWADPVDVDLHASEYGAARGADGHVWAGNARNYRLARRSGGGYLTALGPLDGDGIRAEVYTLFETLRTEAGEITLDLVPVADACAAEPVIRVQRSEGAEIVATTDMFLDAVTCGTQQLAGPGAGLSAIRLAGQR
ncbi:hypothetical protein HMH01_02185 [Halovulum dunhuangense]|uniref:Uncharacterized protein n=1 Tax=Halovulum dunhuangense TaxID=1505036 RepID=A0A849KXF9_9RHOB|nr:hypothetical protein [Halovulum dunhuangense]NNU79237.1 hypothetical protein [Halovulum dunhuangense]